MHRCPQLPEAGRGGAPPCLRRPSARGSMLSLAAIGRRTLLQSPKCRSPPSGRTLNSHDAISRRPRSASLRIPSGKRGFSSPSWSKQTMRAATSSWPESAVSVRPGWPGLERIPVVERTFTAQEKLEIALIENVQREDLSPLEEARAYKTAHGDGGPQPGADRAEGRQGPVDDRQRHPPAEASRGCACRPWTRARSARGTRGPS